MTGLYNTQQSQINSSPLDERNGNITSPLVENSDVNCNNNEKNLLLLAATAKGSEIDDVGFTNIC
jgi:hypothetical protein